jgi:precorrin-4/cobalt-precorrin-4 C11-methyltransferase
MKVTFIGAGPGAADLITVRGARALGEARLVLYAGSLVSTDMLAHCHTEAEIMDTAGMNLEEQVAQYTRARESGWDVARLHSGDPAIYGAISEQMRALEELGIDYEVVPGVSSFTASAAVIKASLTRPEVSQTIIITRADGRASAVPEKESLESLAAHGSSLAIFLSGASLSKVVEELLSKLPASTPAALVCKASWPQEKHHTATLGSLLEGLSQEEWRLSTMLLVGAALASTPGAQSRLYSPEYSHRFRKAARSPKELKQEPSGDMQ